MRMLTLGLAVSFATIAGGAAAETRLKVEGKEYKLSVLLENCNRMSKTPEAQIACFNALTKLVEEQSGGAKQPVLSVPEALQNLQAAAEYRDDATGLLITGTDCRVQVVYFNNYFHLSRRNVSTIDVFSAQFDASRLQSDELVRDQGGQPPLAQGRMDDGVVAVMHGGMAMESSTHRFTPKSARATIESYAYDVISQLPGKEDQVFDFILVHPERRKSGSDIWEAFEAFMQSCAN